MMPTARNSIQQGRCLRWSPPLVECWSTRSSQAAGNGLQTLQRQQAEEERREKRGEVSGCRRTGTRTRKRNITRSSSDGHLPHFFVNATGGFVVIHLRDVVVTRVRSLSSTSDQAVYLATCCRGILQRHPQLHGNHENIVACNKLCEHRCIVPHVIRFSMSD